MAPTPPLSLVQRILFQWKRGWNEIPEVMGAGVIGTTSGILCVAYVWSLPTERLVSRYKRSYFVMRSDDPRLAGVKRFSDSPAVTFGGPDKVTECN